MTRTILRSLLLSLALAGCGDSSSPPDEPDSGVVQIITSGGVFLEATDTVTLSAVPVDSLGSPVPNIMLTWSSLQPGIATVSDQGLVTGISPGDATIRVKGGGRQKDILVRVPPPAVTMVFTIVTDTVIVRQGLLLRVEAHDADNNLITRSFHWSSSDTLRARTASGNDQGEILVLGVGPGAVTITARLGAVSASKVIQVYPAVDSVEVLPADTAITLGQSQPMTVVLRDSTGTILNGRPYSFGSSGIALVTSGGIATGINAGQGTVTVTAEGVLDSTHIDFNMETRLVQLAMSNLHSCGLTTGGKAYCWGDNGAGQLGIGFNTPATGPIAVPGNQTWAYMTVGGGHTCALTAAGAAYCWGSNEFGQAGLDPATTPNCNGTCTGTPTPVVGGHVFTSLVAGATHSCGLDGSGQAWCWGTNGFGELGTGTVDAMVHFTPLAVTGGHTFTAIGTGYGHSCGQVAGGELYCWGLNTEGQLGIGALDALPHPNPALVGAGMQFDTLRIDSYTLKSCAIDPSAIAYCWGNLASGSFTAPHMLRADPVLGVSHGTGHVCVLLTTGAAECFGNNHVGQLGRGTTSGDETQFAPVSGGHVFTTIWTGNQTTCGRDTTGILWCWGEGFHYQLGTNDRLTRLVPTRVAGQP
jgi:alpha-tubulin suppressor-like RCC1 family protein